MFKIYIVFVIKADTTNKNARQILSRMRAVIAGLTANANFPTTNPTLVALTTRADDLEQAILEAEGGDRNKVAALRVMLRKSKELLVKLATDINLQSDGSLLMALTSGFSERAPKTPAGVLPSAGNARGKALGNGRIVINWGALKGRHSYRVYSSLDPNAPNSWELCGETSKNRLLIEDLTPGTLYYFRIVGVNNFGEGTSSDVVAIRCV